MGFWRRLLALFAPSTTPQPISKRTDWWYDEHGGRYSEKDLSDPNWRMREAAMKAKVGQARLGTTQYSRNAAQVLSVHAGPGMRPETRAKLEALSESGDPETRAIASRALGRSSDGKSGHYIG